jgi:ATP-dependent protease ClpP protease subunit
MMQNKRINKSPYGFVYDIDYVGGIKSPDHYLEDFHIYRNAGPQDVIKIHINSFGGEVSTLIQLINLIRTCQAQIITFLEGDAHSADSMLFLQGDQFVVGEHAAMLIHESSGGNWDYQSKSKKYHEFSSQHMDQIFRSYYKDFLTEEEMNDVLAGQDLWLGAEEITRRLEIKCESEKDTSMDEGFAEEMLKWKKKNLQAACKEEGIEYTSRDTKEQLVEKLLK